MSAESTERAIIRVVAAAQFINVLEFVIVMPLGPDFAAALDIPMNRLSYVASSYTAAAAIVGLAGAFFLDRFDRRKALIVALSGLVISTASAGLAHRFWQLVVSRALAGFFGGPATSLSMSIVADAVPNARRGRALSIVMMAFSLASIFGVPAGLELARWVGWRAPFFAIALLGTLAVALTTSLPPLRAHLERTSAEPPGRALLRIVSEPTVPLSYLMTFATQFSGFLLIPVVSPYLQYNLGFPRAQLSWLYFGGGMVSLFATRVAGRLVDRFGSLRIGTGGLLLLTCIVTWTFARQPTVPWTVVGVGFMLWFFAQAFRNVAYNTLASKVPANPDRASFQSLQSAVTHIAIASGAFVGGQLLATAPGGSLIGMPRVAWLSIGVSLLIPLFMWQVERRVNARSQLNA